MATYKEIKGTDITVVSSDPSNPVTGEVWYNTTTQKLKGYQQVLGNAWSTGGNLNTGRFAAGAAGTQTAGLAFSGYSGGSNTNKTEKYDGSTWTEVNNMNTARYNLAGAGSDSTSALGFGGWAPGSSATTEEWNGTNWTEVNDLNTARSSLWGVGISAEAALAIGGKASYGGPTAQSSATEEWNVPSTTTKTISTD